MMNRLLFVRSASRLLPRPVDCCVHVLGCRLISGSPLTVRSSRNATVKKVWKDLKAKEEMEKYEMMQPVDIHELPRGQQSFVLDLDRYIKEKVTREFSDLYKGLTVLVFFLVLILGIYYFSCWAMGQESILDEIDEEVAVERGELVLDEHGKLVPAQRK